MIRTVVLLAASSFVCLALASGDNAQESESSNCKMPSQLEATAARKAVQQAAGDKIDLAVTGLTCGGCADQVTAALRGLDGVEAAFVDHTTGTANIAYDGKKTNLDALIAAISEAGAYTAVQKEAARN